jgi:hypothetical protein
MIETEVAETLMSLSAPDERQFASPLYAHEGLPWHPSQPQPNDKKRSFQSFTHVALASSLPTASSSYLDDYAMLQRKIHERPLTSMIPAKHRRRDVPDDDDEDDDDEDEEEDHDHDNDSSDVDMATQDSSSHSDASSEGHARRPWRGFRSPFDGLVAAAASNQSDHEDDFFAMARSAPTSSSRPISIPSKRDPFGSSGHFHHGTPPRPPAHHHHHQQHDHHRHGLPIPPRRSDHKKWSLSRVKEDASYIGQDSSPTGVEDDRAWFDEYRQTDEYRQRARLASVCSSDGSTGISEYGGFGRKHLEEFIRMEISAANESENQPNDHNMDEDTASGMIIGSPPSSLRDGDGKYIGSYSPEARRKRIDRFLEKRKHRVWSKKVDYDVRKNFANSRLRVKGRFVKKEDEELLCQLMSFT